SNSQTHAGVPLFELDVEVVAPVVGTVTRRVVVCSTVAVVIVVCSTVAVVTVVCSTVVSASAARPPEAIAPARGAPAPKRAARAASFIAVGTTARFLVVRADSLRRERWLSTTEPRRRRRRSTVSA